MSLRVKFLLATLLASCPVAALGAWHLFQVQQEAFASETRERVELIANFGDSGREYIWQHAARATMEQTDALVLETMSPAFAVRGLFDIFHRLAPEYLYRSPSFNPSRREDLPTELEAQLIRQFDSDRTLGQLSGFADVDGARKFYVAKPIVTEPGCLMCHGPAAQAPEVMRTRYGTTSGYDWPLDRIINALVIYVPTADLDAFRGSVLRTAGISFLASHVLIFLLLNVLFDRLIGRRVARVATVMARTAAAPGQPMAIGDRRNDEIGVVSRTFDRMSASLAEAYRLLEQRVIERTRELAAAKGEAEDVRDKLRIQLHRIDRELQAARELQLGLVPASFRPPSVGRPLDVAAVMRPALEVGGDFYDVLELGQGRVCAVIGDVAGKGAAAALFMALTLSVIRLIVHGMPESEIRDGMAARVLTLANREICAANPSMMFVTLLVLVLDTRTGILELANAGHLPPWRLGAHGPAQLPLPAMLAAGIDPSIVYTTTTAELRPDEALLLCTDGVTEAMDPATELFGNGRLEAALIPVACQPSTSVVEATLRAVETFEGTAEAGDDVTMLVLRRVTL